MAGPGGGPSRRSHTKSRKGCKTCKRRHIRCDESFPQCRNCTKHQVKCDYMDNPTLASQDGPQSPRPPHLPWPSDVDAVIEHWKQTGEYPFPDLGLYTQPTWQRFSKSELRLFHHISSVSREVLHDQASKMTIWVDYVPKFLSLSASHACLVNAVLAFAASHLAHLSRSQDTRNLAHHYYAAAFKGLHEAMANFSRQNGDASLATSLLLQWQATDWQSWSALTVNTHRIACNISPWKHESWFPELVTTYAAEPPRHFSNFGSSAHRAASPRSDQLVLLQSIHDFLRRLLQFLSQYEQESKWIEQLCNYMEHLKESNFTKSHEEQFNQLYALRKWLFWVPISLLSVRKGDFVPFIVIACFFSASLTLEPIFPDIGSSMCADLIVEPLKEVHGVLERARTSPNSTIVSQAAVIALDFSQNALATYKRQKELGNGLSVELPSLNQHGIGRNMNTMNLELEGQLPTYTYGSNAVPSLSPAFPPPVTSPMSFFRSTTSGQTSPYLEVPGSAMEGFPGMGGSYISRGSTASVSPQPTYATQQQPESSYGFGAPLAYNGGNNLNHRHEYQPPFPSRTGSDERGKRRADQ